MLFNMTNSNVVIRVDGLGKKYLLDHQQSHHYTALRDVLARQVRAAAKILNPFTLAGQLHKAKREPARAQVKNEEEFWALKDVSFEIYRGDRVGIIGRNGAGKSTLLKILSRITEPTVGRVEILGRVASLLEVGTGFHPELTGRENIFLNSAILGMTRRETISQFDEIVAFAEVEKFLDTPVKRYSSGMYVRLAFAVAAHLEPEILIVDEVLAVGDTSFQKKCLGKMESISQSSDRTVLFVSHQMAAVSKLCNKALLLSNGNLIESGITQDIVNKYVQTCAGPQTFTEDLENVPRYSGQKNIFFSSIQLFSDGQKTNGTLFTGALTTIRLEICATSGKNFSFEQGKIALGISNDVGVQIVLSSEMMKHIHDSSTGPVRYVDFTILKNPLTPGLYQLNLFMESAGVIQDWINESIFISVESGDFYGSGRMCPAGLEGKLVLVSYSISIH